MVKIAIEIGQKAPDFALKNQNQEDIKLRNFRGKRVILAFYPFDFSPVCTDEMSCFQADLKKLNSADSKVLAISVDSHWSHKAFAGKLNLNYDLLSDFNKEASKKYGVLRKEGFSNRAYFIIDKDGVIRYRHVGFSKAFLPVYEREIIELLKQ